MVSYRFFSLFKKKKKLVVTFFLYNKYKLILRTKKEAIVVDELKSCTRKHNHIGI